MSLSKHSCIVRALELLKNDDPISIRYACLELRYCIEAISYEKAKLYRKHLPYEVVAKWQPRKLIDALVEFDPYVNENFSINLWFENQDGSKDKLIFSGSHNCLPSTFLKKHYNKLGFYLHVPTIAQKDSYVDSQETAKIKDYLLSIADSIRASADNLIDSNIAETVSAYCQECNQFIIRNVKSLEKNPIVVCTNSQCMAQYDVTVTKNGSMWKLRTFDIECPDCKIKYYYGLHLLNEGAVVKCDECQSEFIIHRQWILKRKAKT